MASRTPQSRREKFERDQDAEIAAGWKCEKCGDEHGRFHPMAPSVRVYIRVFGGKCVCQLCEGGDDAA